MSLKTSCWLFPGQEELSPRIFEQLQLRGDKWDTFCNLVGVSAEEILRRGIDTRFVQPFLFNVQAILSDLLRVQKGSPSYAVGYSLGEYSALYSAEALTFSDGLQLVTRRASLMADTPLGKTSTLWGVSLPPERIEDILSQFPHVWRITDHQHKLVISGKEEEVVECVRLLSPSRCRYGAIPVAFHTPLMQMAANDLQGSIEAITWRTPRFPVYASEIGRFTSDIDSLKKSLLWQMVNPIYWEKTKSLLKVLSVCDFIEMGLIKKLVRDFDWHCTKESGLELALTNKWDTC
jgi:[acyl-carrier-protein] S-malonyltransferase